MDASRRNRHGAEVGAARRGGRRNARKRCECAATFGELQLRGRADIVGTRRVVERDAVRARRRHLDLLLEIAAVAARLLQERHIRAELRDVRAPRGVRQREAGRPRMRPVRNGRPGADVRGVRPPIPAVGEPALLEVAVDDEFAVLREARVIDRRDCALVVRGLECPCLDGFRVGDGNRAGVLRAGRGRLAAVERVVDGRVGRRARDGHCLGAAEERRLVRRVGRRDHRRRHDVAAAVGKRDAGCDFQILAVDGTCAARADERSAGRGARHFSVQAVAADLAHFQSMSVEVDGRASIKGEIAERGPVAVGAELHGLRAGAEREVLRRERILTGAVDLDHKGRDEGVAAFDNASAVAAARVAGDETEPVPAFRHLYRIVVLAHRLVHIRPFVVDHQ